MKKSKKMQTFGPARGGIVFAIMLVILLVSATAVPAATTFTLIPDTVYFVYTFGDTITSQVDSIKNLTPDTLTWGLTESIDFVSITPPLTDTISANATVAFTLTLDTAAARARGAGTYLDSVKCFDSTNTDSAFLKVNLVVNTAPTLAFIGSKSVDEGALLSFTVSASDADGPTPVLSMTNVDLPGSPSFTAATGAFDWTAGSQDSGSYTVIFTATDSSYPGVTDFEPVTITVNPVPDWAPDAMVTLGNITACDSAIITNFAIVNQSGNSQTFKSSSAITVSGSSFFRFVPALSSFNGISIANGNSVVFDSIIFSPTNLNQIASGDSIIMTLNYLPNVSESFPIVRARGCAGIGNAPSSLGFGPVNIGQTGVGSVRIQNDGACDLTVSGINLVSTEYTVTNEPAYPLTLTAGNGFDFAVSFSPGTLGLKSATLSIFHDGFVTSCPLGDTSTVSLTGNGIDTAPPTIDSVLASSIGDVVDIYVSDPGSGVDTLTLRYRLGSSVASALVTTQPSFVGDKTHWQFNLNAGDISDAQLAQFGYEIEVTVTDLATNSDTSGFISINGGYSDSTHSITKTSWLGGNDSTWHLVSIPGNLTTASVQRIFQQLSGLPANNNVGGDSWRLVRINNWISSSDNSTTVLTTQGGGTISSGEGYWFRHFTLDFDGIELPAGQTHRTDQLFPITLTRGWNLIGNPFHYAVGIEVASIPTGVSSLIAQNSVAEPGSTSWDSPLVMSTALLQPWKGYAIYSDVASATIFLDPKKVVARAPADNSWMAEISMISGGRNNGSVTIGLSDLASDGIDMTDCRPVTLLGGRSSILLKHTQDGRFSKDMRTRGILQEWELEIFPLDNGRKTLTWAFDKLPSDDHVLLLRDIVANQVIDMSAQSSYNIPSSQQLPENRFRVYLGRTDEVNVAVAELQSTLPLSYKLYQNYPNPFNPTTSISFDLARDGQVEIEVYNVLGEKVKVLVSDQMTAGSHVIQWDGRNDRGRRVASGVYFAQMKAGDTRSTIKLSLIK